MQKKNKTDPVILSAARMEAMDVCAKPQNKFNDNVFLCPEPKFVKVLLSAISGMSNMG